MPTTTVVNDAAFWEWLRNKVRKDNQDIKNIPVSLELPIDDPSLVVPPTPDADTTTEEKDENTTEVDHVIYQF